MNDILVLLFSAGAAAFLTALVAGIKNLRSQRVESEDAIIKRLNESASNAHRDAARQRRRAESAEVARDVLRTQRDAALEEASQYLRIILTAGLPDPRVKKNDDES